MWRRAFVCSLLVTAVVGCSKKPPTTPEAQHLPPAVAPAEVAAPAEKSIDEQIAEALGTVDPIVLYKRTPLQDDENAFVLLQQGMSNLAEPMADEDLDDPVTDAINDGPIPDGKHRRILGEWLEKNAPALASIDAGIALKQCQFPETDVLNMELPYLAQLRQAARVKLVRAKLMAVRGESLEAARELAGVLRLGKLVASGDGMLIHYLVGMAIRSMGTKGVRWLVASDGATDEALALLILALASDGRGGADMAQALRSEFMCFFIPMHRHILQQMQEKGAPKALAETMWLFLGIPLMTPEKERTLAAEEKLAELLPDVELIDVGETVRLSGKVHARLVKRALNSWTQAPKEEQVDVVATMESWKKGPPPRNPVGKILVDFFTSVSDVIIERSFRMAADRSATRAVLALRLFEMRNGRLPENLAELVTAGILDAIPVDPFTNKPLRYSRERRRVWSVGPDEKDDGGHDKPGVWYKVKDYVLEVPGSRAP